MTETYVDTSLGMVTLGMMQAADRSRRLPLQQATQKGGVHLLWRSCGEMSRQQGQGHRQKVGVTAQPAPKHATGHQTEKVDLQVALTGMDCGKDKDNFHKKPTEIDVNRKNTDL